MIFINRFEDHFLPKIRTADGWTALIGDNLASHINVRVIELCQERKVKFICLPPNTTGICQPLDVAVYRTMKGYWRTILRNWKESPEGRKNVILSKEQFPTLLKRLVDKLKPTIQSNLKFGFRSCGIYPTDVEPLLEKCA